MKRRRRIQVREAELDITTFMNLMIVLVPILLLGMVFSRIAEIEVTLQPGVTRDDIPSDLQQIELVLRTDGMQIDYPSGVQLKRIPLTASGEYDFELLSLVLQEVKRQLREKGVQKNPLHCCPRRTLITRRS